MILNPAAGVRILRGLIYYKASITAQGLPDLHSSGVVHWVPEQLNIKAVAGACKLIDGYSLALCSATVSVVLAGICHENKVNSIARLYQKTQPRIVSITLHYITLHYITLHYITLHYITLHYITLHYITLHHITLHRISSHHITSHHISSHHITSHHITSHHIKPPWQLPNHFHLLLQVFGIHCQTICLPFQLFLFLEELSNITYSSSLTLTVVQNLARSNQLFVIQRQLLQLRRPETPCRPFKGVPSERLRCESNNAGNAIFYTL